MEFSGWPSKKHCIWNNLVQTVVEKIIFLKMANEILVWESHTKILLKYINIVAAAAKSLQSCPTLCDPTDGQPTRLRQPWDSPGKNTGVGSHFLLQCMKVKSESEVAQSLSRVRLLATPWTAAYPGSSVHGIFPGKSTGVVCHCLLRKYCWIYIE